MNEICLFCLNMTALQWLGLGVALLAFELMFPGIFMLWFGLGALITASLVYLFNIPNLLAIAIFLLAGVALSYFFYQKQNKDPKFLVNDSSNKMVGKIIILDESIINGRGRVKIADSHWTVNGPDLLAGTKVKIVEIKGNTLIIIAC